VTGVGMVNLIPVGSARTGASQPEPHTGTSEIAPDS